MPDFLHDPFSLRVASAIVGWDLLHRSLRRNPDVTKRNPAAEYDEEQHPWLQLRWMVSELAGIPPEPFTVWARRGKDALAVVEPTPFTDASLEPCWGFDQPMLTVECDVVPDAPGRNVGLWAFAWFGGGKEAAVDSHVVASASGPLQLRVRAPGIWSIQVSGGAITQTRAFSVSDALKDEWEELEYVGLPVPEDRWATRTYQTHHRQGPVGAALAPPRAAAYRMRRGIPLVGWPLVTEAGRNVGAWQPHDPDRYVTETVENLLTDDFLGELFDATVVPNAQSGVAVDRNTPLEVEAGATAPDATAKLFPFGVAAIAAGNDPAANLALGFGTGYPLRGADDEGRDWPVFGRDLLISAHYPSGRGGGGEETVAAIAPWPARPHLHYPPESPIGVQAERAGVVRPAGETDPWLESIRVCFDGVDTSLALDRPVGSAVARYDASSDATVLNPIDDNTRGHRAFVLSRRPDPHSDQVAHGDNASDATGLPLDGSARTLGYAACLLDLFGAWSQWSDASYSGAAPKLPVPIVSNAALHAPYAGSPVCSCVLTFDLSLDWEIRHPKNVTITWTLYPLASSSTPVPTSGGTTVSQTITFDGDRVDTGSLLPGVAVVYVSANGQDHIEADDPQLVEKQTTSPAGVRDTRRYQITVDNVSLDFSTTSHYAIAAAATAETTAVPGQYSETSERTTPRVGSPVPPAAVLTAPLVVPLGSMPDADGRSHVAVPAGASTDAAKIAVYIASEQRVRLEADITPAQAPRTISHSDRYAALQNAYDTLGDKQRRVFTRYATVDASATNIDVALPPGSSDIHLFATTAVSASGIESGWPQSHSNLHAAIAPELVTPTTPEVLAEIATPSPLGGPAIATLTLSARCPLPITRFEVYATRLERAARDVGTMGPPLAEVPVSPTPGSPETPEGALYAATTTIAVAEEWRPLLVRVVAIPVAVDTLAGIYGARSQASPLTSLALDPSGPPDLSAISIDSWADDSLGVVARFTSTAPMYNTRFGPHTLTVSARGHIEDTDTGALLEIPATPLLGITLDANEPPAHADMGVAVRHQRTSQTTPYALWFRRPGISTAVHLEVVLKDPRGRVSVKSVDIPPELLHAPTVTITNTQQSGLTAIIVTFTTDAPDADDRGAYVLDISASRPRLFPVITPPHDAFTLPRPSPPLQPVPPRDDGIHFPFPPRQLLTKTIALPDIRDASVSPLQPTDIDIVRTDRTGSIATYDVSIQLTPPVVATIKVTAPDLQAGAARVTL